jgi:GTP-binding protein
MKNHIPTVVLAGRPNVGKSTLFNRITRSRRSITDPTPGVTRDCVEKKISLSGKTINLVDTGGFKLTRSGDIEEEVFKKTLRALETADVIVLILAAGEITSEDEEFIAHLRKYVKKTIVAVNKTEGGRREGEAWNYLSYGFESLFFISAEHGDNILELTYAIETKIAKADGAASAHYDDIADETEGAIKIAIVGKPNTGKSTLSNVLLGKESSIVSEVAGTTRDVIEGAFTHKGQKFLSLDTAGIRRKTKVNENIEYYSVNRAIRAIGDADIVILMIDAKDGLADQDKKIAALACEKGRPVIFALNKWDLMDDTPNAFNAVSDSIRYFFGQMNYAPILPLSAKDNAGVDALLKTVVKVYAQLTRKIETSTLNEVLARWQVEYPPPSGPQTRLSIKYGVQTQANPVSFSFFVTRPKALKGNYASYIENKIRQTLGFSLVPITIEWKGSRSATRVHRGPSKKK